MLFKVWSGPVEILTATSVQAKDTKFLQLSVTNTDKLVLLPLEGEESAPETQLPDLDCIRAMAGDLLEVRSDADLQPLVSKNLTLQIWRDLQRPCPICERAGLYVESDHKHCEISRERLALSYPFAFSAAQREKAMTALLEQGAFAMSVPLFNSKRVVQIHSTTFGENDAKREWEQEFIGGDRDFSLNFYAEQEARVHAAYALDDDGTGRGPFKSLSDEHRELPSVARTKVMMDFFKGYTDSAYRILLEQVRRLDSLVEEVCGETLTDHFTDEDLLNLCEDLANNVRVMSEVRYFNGRGKVYFTSASTDEVDRARDWAETATREVRRENNGTILKPRAQDIETLALLACEFRGDQRKRFDETSTFDERATYLMDLPLPLFYMYVRAGNIWRVRTFKAAEPAMVGNF